MNTYRLTFTDNTTATVQAHSTMDAVYNNNFEATVLHATKVN